MSANELLATSPYYRAVNKFATAKPQIYDSYLGQSRSYDAGGFAPIFISATGTDYVQMRRAHDAITDYHVGVKNHPAASAKARQLNEATGNPFQSIVTAVGPQEFFAQPRHPRFATAGQLGFS